MFVKKLHIIYIMIFKFIGQLIFFIKYLDELRMLKHFKLQI